MEAILKPKPPGGVEPQTNGRMLTTYSHWNAFRSCHRLCEWRYIHELVPVQREHALAFGTVIHKCLEMWHSTKQMANVYAVIEEAYPNAAFDDEQRASNHLALAMMNGYYDRYHDDPLDVVALEQQFVGQIVNPTTGAASRTMYVAGKVDGIVKHDGEFYLLEHKTASQIDGAYLDKLWTDLQVTLYAWYAEQALGIHISGVIYNVLVKARIRQGAGESEAEFQARRAGLLAKSKTGTTTATRKMPESDEEFTARLAEKYTDPEMFHREVLYISRDNYDAMRSDLWELTQEYLHCRQRGTFGRNTGHCFANHRACVYYLLCQSNGSSLVIDNYYEHKPAHSELLGDDTNDTDMEMTTEGAF